MGSLVGNGGWQQYNRPLSDGVNLVAFLAFLENRSNRVVYFVFANQGSLATYSTGDSLLLDDISLHYE